MSKAGSATLGDFADDITGSDSPTVGETLETTTHRAHTRYAAHDEPGVVWYDPRDGRENYTIRQDITVAAFDGMDNRVLLGISVRPFRPDEAADGRYVVFQHKGWPETFSRFIDGEHIDGLVRVGTVRDSDVFDSLEEAGSIGNSPLYRLPDGPVAGNLRAAFEGASD